MKIAEVCACEESGHLTFPRLFDEAGIDIAQIDLTRCGRFTEAMLVAEYVTEAGTKLRYMLTRRKIRARDGQLETPQEPGLVSNLVTENVNRFRVS